MIDACLDRYYWLQELLFESIRSHSAMKVAKVLCRHSGANLSLTDIAELARTSREYVSRFLACIYERPDLFVVTWKNNGTLSKKNWSYHNHFTIPNKDAFLHYAEEARLSIR